jgi:hypothetical protein
MGSYTKYAMSKSYPTRQRFYGSDDFFDSALIKSNVLIMGSCELNGEARYIHGQRARNVYLYGGHDPEDFQHQVGKRQRSWIYILIPRLPINFK